MPFTPLGLSAALLKAVADSGYSTPTPIQSEVIPAILQGKDIVASAQTGTGKTAAFCLPILQQLAKTHYSRNRPLRALILTPTRELAVQVGEVLREYGQYQQPRLKSAVVFGGVKINPQMMQLRGGVDVLIATPGRLLDLVSQNAIKLNQLEILVLDEADRMLSLGFSEELGQILALLPKRRQNLLFSATFPSEIEALAAACLRNPLRIAVAAEQVAAISIEQRVYSVNQSAKTALLIRLIKTQHWQQVLVFTASKHSANRLVDKLNAAQIQAAAIHGDKSQAARTTALAGFKAGQIRVLVATDLIARGIDIEQLPYVVNFELPRSAQDYVHRIGRTGRAGQAGLAVSLVAEAEQPALKLVEKLLGFKLSRAESNLI